LCQEGRAIINVPSLSELKVKEGCPALQYLTHYAASCASDSIETLSDHNHNVHHSIPDSPAVLSGKWAEMKGWLAYRHGLPARCRIRSRPTLDQTTQTQQLRDVVYCQQIFLVTFRLASPETQSLNSRRHQCGYQRATA
jgi:hypothetical protein